MWLSAALYLIGAGIIGFILKVILNMYKNSPEDLSSEEHIEEMRKLDIVESRDSGVPTKITDTTPPPRIDTK